MGDGFLTAEPALTPLIAGTTTLTIAATLAAEFGLPGNITAIIISMIFASLIVINKEVPLVKRVVLYFINVTTIFIIAMGLNSAGVVLSNSNKDEPVERGMNIEESAEKPFFHEWF
jgi:hypothetical protein